MKFFISSHELSLSNALVLARRAATDMRADNSAASCAVELHYEFKSDGTMLKFLVHYNSTNSLVESLTW